MVITQHRGVINRHSLARQAYEALRDRILNGELPPGASLTIGTLAEEYSISTTPIREAVKQLEKDGLVLVKPRSGTVVATVEDREIADLYQIRMMIEMFAAQHGMPKVTDADVHRLSDLVEAMEALLPIEESARQVRHAELDREFHTTVVEMLGNDQMNAYYTNLRQRLHLMRLKLVRGAPGNRDTTSPEHRAILEAYRARDAAAAMAALERHLTSSRQSSLSHTYEDAEP